ncbi:hypothetical protein [Desulfitobacterium hafniense]|uniref:hypothetical protein n=1 Tax=Desulfitobacterium hafniense TaxID=49338 RepID=UPI0002D7E302|nr:hypothetical protein [Desulfitobacterium hafniense]
MVLKGIVSSAESSGIRVVFPDKENLVSAPLPAALNIGALDVGNKVVVVFFSDSLQDGVIIAKY